MEPLAINMIIMQATHPISRGGFANTTNNLKNQY